MAWPIDNLAICIVRLFSTEWWPTNKALEHDSTNTPPIAALVIAFAAEDFRRDVIRSTNCREGQLTARLTPSVDFLSVRDCELDLVYADRITIRSNGLGPIGCHELLVI